MFDKKILEIIKSKISDIEKISFDLDQHIFHISDYDKINACILFNAIADEEKDNLVIFNSHGSIFLLYAVAILSFFELIKDLKDEKNSLINNLKVGDRVMFDGCLGIYQGRDTYSGRDIHNGKEYLLVKLGGKFNEIRYVFIPEGLARLQKYSGLATVLRGYSQKKGLKAISPQKVLSEMLHLEINKLNIVRSSRIAIITDKKIILDYLRELKIRQNRFIDIFPTVRLVNPEKCQPIPGCRSKSEPVIYIASNFNTLIEFIQKGNNINTIILDGESKIRNNYGNINTLKDNNMVENILILLDHRSLTEEGAFKNMGFKTWTWTQKDITEINELTNCEFPEEIPFCPFSNHYKVLRHLTKQRVNLVDVRLPKTEIVQRFEDNINLLKDIALRNRSLNVEKINGLLYSAYGLLFYFQHIVFPVDFCLELEKKEGLKFYNPENELNKLKVMADELLLRYVSSEFKDTFQKLISGLETIKDYFIKNNFKADKLIELIGEKGLNNTAVIVRKPWYKDVLLQWLGQNKARIYYKNSVEIVDFKSFQKLTEQYYYDRVIFSGWFGYENRYIFNSGITPQINFLLYPFEKIQVIDFLNNLNADSYNLRDIPTRASLLGIDIKDFPLKKREIIPKNYGEYADDVTKIINDISLMMFSDMKRYSPEGESEAIEAKHVVFEEEAHAFFTKNYNAKRLNRIEAKIEPININELNTGDEIIFIGDTRRDIFDQLTQVAESSSSFTEEVKLSKLWKEAIRKYMISEGKGIMVIAQELKKAGCERHSFTIENWLSNENLIGPEDESGTIKAIAEITGDNELHSNLKGVIYACRKIRALHIRLGRYLAQCIVASMDTQKETKIEGIMKERIKELSQHILIMQIKAIGENIITVSKNKVNRLLEFNE